MRYINSEEGLSEVIGFILILGLLTIAMSIYVVYEVPAQGRLDEIDHMNSIKDRFVDYKTSLDSLWVNSLGFENINSLDLYSPYGINLGTSFVMGTGGGYKTGASSILPVFFPIPSAGSMNINQADGHILIIKDGTTVVDKDIGKLSYISQNNYWLDQEYYYQMGGVFLKQTDGITSRVDPPVSFYGQEDAGLIKLAVQITPISVKCPTTSQSVGGSGPVVVDTRYKNEGQYLDGWQDAGTVSIQINTASVNEADAWKKVFLNAFLREGIPSSYYSYTNPSPESVRFDITGPGSLTNDILLNIYNADFSVSLQNVASSLE